MMYFFLIIVISVAIIFIVAQKNKNKIPLTRADEYNYPKEVEISDFTLEKKLLSVIVFTSNVCDSCKSVWDKAKILSSDSVMVTNVEYEDSAGKKLHKKYSIDAVPTIIICGPDGSTLKSYIGQVSAADLWAGVASLRDVKNDSNLTNDLNIADACCDHPNA